MADLMLCMTMLITGASRCVQNKIISTKSRRMVKPANARLTALPALRHESAPSSSPLFREQLDSLNQGVGLVGQVGIIVGDIVLDSVPHPQRERRKSKEYHQCSELDDPEWQ